MASGIEAEGVSRDGGVHDLRWEFFPPLLREVFFTGLFCREVFVVHVARRFYLFFSFFVMTGKLLL
jgi:hypothetical protein